LLGVGFMNRKQRIGSATAKGGFANENDIVNKFLNWCQDAEAQSWLKAMNYDPQLIETVEANRIPLRINNEELRKLGLQARKFEEIQKYKKADARIRVKIKVCGTWFFENLSLKKAKAEADYNQVDKRPVDTYKEMWGFSDEIELWLKLFTGELNPYEYRDFLGNKQLRDDRRLFIDEMPINIQNDIIEFFTNNKIAVVCDILKGRGALAADWFLVTKQDKCSLSWVLKEINYVLNHYGQGEVVVSPKGSLYIGKITMQRKGGTPDPESLQFKISPNSLFNKRQI